MEKEAGRFNIFRSGLAGVSAVRADTDITFPRHIHDQFGIGVVERGAQKSLSGRGRVEAGSGDTITVNPGEVHDGAPIGDRGRTWSMLYLEPSLVSDISSMITDGRRMNYEFSLPVIHQAEISSRFRGLFYAVTSQNTEAAALLREEVLLLLFSDLMAEPSSGRWRAAPDIMRNARELIDSDPAAPISLDDLARETSLGKFQVLRGFEKLTGLTPHAYLIQRRIHLARNLITRGMPLAEVSAASGFADQSHMNRLFLRNFGITPGAYAKAVA